MATKRMLVDGTHPEETRIVVTNGNRLEEFDFESQSRRQLRGNIYLAKVTRVEPSLQAAFVEYGGTRHGFLAFSEIHPDYYLIPVADRQALIEAEERAHREAEEENENRSNRRRNRHRSSRRRSSGDRVQREIVEGVAPPLQTEGHEHEGHEPEAREHEPNGYEGEHAGDAHEHDHPHDFREAHADHHDADERREDEHPDDEHHDNDRHGHDQPAPQGAAEAGATAPIEAPAVEPGEYAPAAAAAHEDDHPVHGEAEHDHEHHENDHHDDHDHDDQPAHKAAASGDEAAVTEHEGRVLTIVPQDENGAAAHAHEHHGDDHDDEDDDAEEEVVESVGGDDVLEEVPERTFRPRRQYKIQEVIKRRQVMLVQAVKEERGNKGAALTTYLSLAGRYSVLMPNTARGGGISRKITSGEDRNRLKEIAQELEVPEGMGVILRTAGAARAKMEVKRDFEYLLRLWETVRDLTPKPTAPTLASEEGPLVKRSIRDLYSKDIDEIIVAGEAGYKEARDFMRMLMPSHVKNVKLYSDAQPLFTRYGIESQLDAMFQPTVQLRSGGYIVINQTAALVAIDVNSGRATREHHIEDTALKTNCEAADEVARQLRLRDLAGLIVIDFIDMDEGRNNRTVERRMKDALKHDRARIQVGRISHFGLLEMSRQHNRTTKHKTTTEKTPNNGGLGHVRSGSSVCLQLLRALEE